MKIMKTKHRLRRYWGAIACLLIALGIADGSLAGAPTAAVQQMTVSGVVFDDTGLPRPGASVVEKGTTNGTQTDAKGAFTIRLAGADAVLVITSVGFEKMELNVGSRTRLEITLSPITDALDEVVVIGYGKSSKRKITSAVTQVSAKELATYPFANTMEMLTGRAKGVITMVQGGQPGTLPTISIRGGGEPLYIIDGVPASKQEFAAISPADIESFSILKDAAAASVYGARAGNGVVLITTRAGDSGAVRITYNSSVAFATPTTPIRYLAPEAVAEALDRASFYNGGRITFMDMDGNGSLYWNRGRLDSIKQGIWNNPWYGKTDWNAMVLEDHAPSQIHDLSISGGGGATRYHLSGRFAEQNGIVKNDVFNSKRYNARLNVTHDFEDIGLAARASASLNQQDQREPPQSIWGIMTGLYRQNSFANLFTVGGNPRGGPENPYLMIDPAGGYRLSNNAYLNLMLDLEWKVPGVKGLTASAMSNYRVYRGDRKNWFANARGTGQSYDVTDQKENMGPPHLNQLAENNKDYTLQLKTNYNKALGRHTVDATFVYEELANTYSYIGAARTEYQTAVIEQINGGPSSTATNSGSQTESARQGYIGRVSYDFDARYMLEANFRYDGSDKFPTGKRWGLFPSVSAGWNIDAEPFMKALASRLDALKLRASWGNIGLDNIGNFQYLSVFNTSNDFFEDGKWHPSLHEGNLVSPDLTWYTRNTVNVGLEFGLFNNRLSGEADYFFYRTTGYLASPQNVYSTPLGKPLPQIKTNSAHRRAGWELGLDWREKRGGVDYRIGANGSWYEELWERMYDEQEAVLKNPLTRLTHQKSYYDRMFIADGYYQNMQEIIDNPRREAATTLRPGDIRYEDINGDGIIDGNDMVRQGRPKFPHLMYGLDLGASWKGISLDVLLQGTGRRNILLESFVRRYATNQIGMVGSEDFWQPGNPDAIYPRYTETVDINGGNNQVNSTHWLTSGMYMRLRNVRVSYDLKRTVLRQVSFVRTLQVYASGLNLLTFSNLNKYQIDPEDGRDGDSQSSMGYPVARTYNFGITCSF